MPRPILYIHGFASSGHSAKAGLLKGAFSEVYTPSLSHIPRLAMETLEQFIAALGPRRPLLVGSSLGGYYALWLSQRLGLPAVLVNPVVAADIPAERVVGLRQSHVDGSRFEFTEEHYRQLADFRVENPDTSRLLLLLQLGDELLDQHKTLERLPGARALVDPGGDHGFQDFARRLEAIRAFAQAQRQ